MTIYIGQTRSRRLIEYLTSKGWGEMTVRGELPPRRRPWAYDNGAYKDWTAGRNFNVQAYERDLERLAAMEGARPDFAVAPDVVAGGPKSLDLSLAWAPRIAHLAPLYLAVQDGMSEGDVAAVVGPFAGLFVGGSLEWKVRTGGTWVALAHHLGRRCHIGRVGTERRLRWARRIGADSIDSCLPLWSADNLARFERGFGDEQGDFAW